MGKPPYKAIRACAAVSFLEYGGLKPILPFLGGRSDAARRVVFYRGHCPPHHRRLWGAVASQCEDSPALRHHKCIPSITWVGEARVFALGGIPGVCSDVACRVAIPSLPRRLPRWCRDPLMDIDFMDLIGALL